MCVWGMESQSCSNSQLSRWFAGVTGLVRPETPRAFLAVWGWTPVALPFQNMPGRAGKETLHTSYSFKDSWQRGKKANVRLLPHTHTLFTSFFHPSLSKSLSCSYFSVFSPCWNGKHFVYHLSLSLVLVWMQSNHHCSMQNYFFFITAGK